MGRRKIRIATTQWVIIALTLMLPAWQAAAQNYPNRPVRMVLPYATGGSTDLMTRLLAQSMSESTGQPVIVDNRPGAFGIFGSDLVAHAAPDGYTVLMQTIPLVVNPSLYPKMPYDTVRDLAPVSLIAASPFVLFTHPSVPAKSVKELIALAKQQPGKLNYSGGVGTNAYIAVELLKYMTDTNIVNIPYKGGGPALMGVVGGEVQLSILGIDTVSSLIKAGKIRALGITSAKRTPALPDVPTIAEAGVPGYEFTSWSGALLPGGTPAGIVNALHGMIAKTMRAPGMAERMAEGTEIIVSTPAQFASHIKSELVRWGKVVKAMGLRAE